ncbi:MAG: serine/threonine-protein kinase [Actinomycetaceae bacterium]|nr:serine/threonine-protein kinase [Actinomycetaceae bacterium]
MRSQRELLPGDEIGGYQLVRLLGTGGTGKVWEVRDAGGCPFALKLLHPQLALDETYRKRIFREAKLLSKVQSEGVIRVCDVEVDSAEPFVVTELVPGPSLKQYVQTQGALPLPEALQIARRLLEILESVHAVGVVHRDVKPANILLGPQGPVLIDFGIAQALSDDRLTATGLVAGTPGWVAPEVVNGKTPDAGADLWGWAATLLFMLTGRSAFGLGTWEAVLSRMALGQVDVAGLDTPVANALRQALGAPEYRPNPWDLLAFLERIAAGQPAGEELTCELSAGNPEAVTQLLGEETEYLLPGQVDATVPLATYFPPEGATELLETPTAFLPTEPSAPTAVFPTQGTSSQYSPENQAFAPAQGGNVENYQGTSLGNFPGTYPHSYPGEPYLDSATEAEEPAPFGGYGRKNFSFILGTLLYVLMGALPLAYGLSGSLGLLGLLLVFATWGIHRSYLRSRYLENLQITSKDRAIALARLPIHLIQAVLGVGLSVAISQAAVILGWYLMGTYMPWDGLELYLGIMARTGPIQALVELIPQTQLLYYLGVFLLSGLFTVITVILGPVGKDFTEGTSVVLQDVLRWKSLKMLVLLLFVGFVLAGIKQVFPGFM